MYNLFNHPGKIFLKRVTHMYIKNSNKFFKAIKTIIYSKNLKKMRLRFKKFKK